MGILLTPEEINNIGKNWYETECKAPTKAQRLKLARVNSIILHSAIAKAQAKKIVAWGDEKCPHWNSEWHLKHYCPKCWQELQKECE